MGITFKSFYTTKKTINKIKRQSSEWGTIIAREKNRQRVNLQNILAAHKTQKQKNCTKKGLHDPDNHDGVITHLEPDILEREVKWAL